MLPSTFGRLSMRVLRRSAAEAVHATTGLDWTRPTDIRATLTERCNYRCVYCTHWRQDSYTDEMTFAEWQGALRSIRDYVGRYAVQLLGGEPTLVPWFLDLVEFCRDQRIDWGVVTNGSSLSAARVERLVRARPLNVDISLDSRTAAVNDRQRGVEGSMRRVSAGVAALIAARRDAGVAFPIRIKSVITRHNIADLEPLVAWVATMPGVLIDFTPVRLWQKDDVAAHYPSAEELQALTAMVDRLKTAKYKGAPIETSVAKLDAVVPHFLGRRNSHGVDACRVGLRSVDIRPNGDVDHCWRFKGIGNLRRQTMAEIWESTARRPIVRQSLTCEFIKTKCSTSCHAHRTLTQDIRRGLQMLRA